MSNANLIDAKIILNDEIKMLDLLAAMIDAFAKGYQPCKAEDDDFELNNLKCWAKELEGYSKVDRRYAGMSSDQLKKELQEEIEFLGSLEKHLESVQSKSPAIEYWKNNISENLYYTKETLARVK
jgi:hypothetical protein